MADGLRVPFGVVSALRVGLAQDSAEVGGDRAGSGALCDALDVGVVVGVRVDVVDDLAAVLGLDELDAGDLEADVVREGHEALHEIVVAALTKREDRGTWLRRQLRAWRDHGAAGVWVDRARVRRAELEAAVDGVCRDRVDVLAAHDLDASDEPASGPQVLLQEGDAVERFLELGGVQVALELGEVVETAHTEALSALVVLRDERRRELARRIPQSLLADDGERARGVDARLAKQRQLIDLADLELDGAAAVDGAATRGLDPVEHRPRVVLRQRVVARVR
ncbi:hypothetical protein ACFPRL_24690 [Pseudoclavibacter helvolus]